MIRFDSVEEAAAKLNTTLPEESKGKNPNRVQGGKTAQRRGAGAEAQFEIACRHYKAQGLLDYTKTNPEFVTLGTTQKRGRTYKYGYHKAKGVADWCLTLVLDAHYGGRTCWIETKAISAKNQKTLHDGIHQYDQMMDSHATGMALAFYLVRWGKRSNEEWRLYPVETLASENRAITFEREAGLLVDAPDGWPVFFPVIRGYVEAGRGGCEV